jgi:hypothetical protein
MLAPQPPLLSQIESITPSIYEASLGCLAKAAWYAFGGNGVIPEHPAAILGTAFHAVVAAANRGRLAVASELDRGPARGLFDQVAQSLYGRAHPLIALKFPSLNRLPYYNQQRERSALIATRIAASRASSTNPSTWNSLAPAPPSLQAESRLLSADRLIAGRADHLDVNSETVVDYKSGYVAEEEVDNVSDAEARQLKLYAYLAFQNGVPISQGAIVRGDGRRCELPISASDAEAEANKARDQLRALNTAIALGGPFNDLASPSSSNCRSCPCIAFCDSFWSEARPEWSPDCGVHLEGQVLESESRQLQGVSLITLRCAIRGGTVSAERAVIEQIPTDWLALGGDNLPCPGDIIRVVHGRQTSTEENIAVVRIDKTVTTVWRVLAEGPCTH